VVGASLAGLRAVEAARETGFEGGITLIGAEEHLPYDRPPLSKACLDRMLDGGGARSTIFRTEEALRDELGVRLVLGTPTSDLDTEGKGVLVGDRAVAYDALVIATGADAGKLPGAGGMSGVHTVRTLDDAIAIRRVLDAGARTVVVGAGFIGSDVAAGARKRGLDVTVLEALPTPLVRAVEERVGAACAALHERDGTPLRCGVGVTGLPHSIRGFTDHRRDPGLRRRSGRRRALGRVVSQRRSARGSAHSQRTERHHEVPRTAHEEGELGGSPRLRRIPPAQFTLEFMTHAWSCVV